MNPGIAFYNTEKTIGQQAVAQINHDYFSQQPVGQLTGQPVSLIPKILWVHKMVLLRGMEL
jgi:hypothetical protein